MKDALLTVGLSYETKAAVHALSVAMDMSKGAVVRSILNGDIPHLNNEEQYLSPRQLAIFMEEREKFLNGVGL